MERYRIPLGRSRTELRVSNSRFIATVTRVSTVQEARRFLSELRAEFPDANHHVYAFRVGYGASVTDGAGDDGEPAGTAGAPVLTVLHGADLGDIAIVIARYFGGTKLGTGGLVTAYTEATKAVLKDLKTEEKVERRRFEIAFSYRLLVPVRRLIEEAEGIIEDEDFAQNVSVSFTAPVEAVDQLSCSLGDLSAGQITLKTSDD